MVSVKEFRDFIRARSQAFAERISGEKYIGELDLLVTADIILL